MNESTKKALNLLVEDCHRRSVKAGWYNDYGDLRSHVASSRRLKEFADRIFVASRLSLIHSEISEALEGDRKSLPDDHLPEYPMSHVELADALIRIFDLAGFLSIDDFAEIVAKKLEYNSTREDHKLENRVKSH